MISKSGMVRLFLSIAFPIHLWAILLFFRDFEWIANRSSSWDAFGVGAYSVAVALIETSLVFLITLLLGSILPKFLGEEKKVLLLTLLFYCLAGWIMIRKTHAIVNESHPHLVANVFLSTGHPYRYLVLAVAAIISLVIISIIGTAYLAIRSNRFVDICQAVIDRVIVLSALYLVTDIAGIIIVIIRNV